MATPEEIGFNEQLRRMSNEDFAGAYLDSAIKCGLGPNDGEILFLDLLEDRQPSNHEEYGTLEERLEAGDVPPMTTTQDQAEYVAARVELVRRAVAYLGITKEQLFGEQ